MNARRVRNVAEHLARGAFDHHHVRRARHEHASGGGLHGDVVGAAVTLDVELLDLECLCVDDERRGDAARGKNDQRGEHVPGHEDLTLSVTARRETRDTSPRTAMDATHRDYSQPKMNAR